MLVEYRAFINYRVVINFFIGFLISLCLSQISTWYDDISASDADIALREFHDKHQGVFTRDEYETLSHLSDQQIADSENENIGQRYALQQAVKVGITLLLAVVAILTIFLAKNLLPIISFVVGFLIVFLFVPTFYHFAFILLGSVLGIFLKKYRF